MNVSRHSSPSVSSDTGGVRRSRPSSGSLFFFFCIGEGKEQCAVLLRATRLTLCGRARSGLHSPRVLSEDCSGIGDCRDTPSSGSMFIFELTAASLCRVATSGSVPRQGKARTGSGDLYFLKRRTLFFSYLFFILSTPQCSNIQPRLNGKAVILVLYKAFKGVMINYYTTDEVDSRCHITPPLAEFSQTCEKFKLYFFLSNFRRKKVLKHMVMKTVQHDTLAYLRGW